MEHFHDPVKHLKNLRQALSQKNKPIAFLIGAGCPLAVNMPDPKDWPLIPNVKQLTEFVNGKLKSPTPGTKNNYNTLLEELTNSGRDNENIEDILSFVRTLKEVSQGGTVRKLSETNLVDIEKDICKTILEKLTKELPDKNTPYHQLVSWISSIDREVPIEVFTTNYDLLMEQAFEDLKNPYFDGFIGARKPFFDLRAVEEKGLISRHCTRYWKIHGSINWFQGSKSGDEVYRGFNLDQEDTALIYPSHLKYEQSRKMPFLAMFDRLNNFLRQKESPLLITLGYSFCDMHINYALVNALRSNPFATVIGLVFGTSEQLGSYALAAEKGYEEAKSRTMDDKVSNLSVWTYDEAIIGTIRGKWKYFSKKIDELDSNENPFKIIESFEVKEVDDDGVEVVKSTHHIVKLSDFNQFGSFLQSLVGDNIQVESEK